MTFMLTAIVVQPLEASQRRIGDIIVDPVTSDANSWARAGYLPSLSRYFADPVAGDAYYLVTSDDKGYESSNAFFEYDDARDTAYLLIPARLHEHFEHALEGLVAHSEVGRVILVAEDNGHVTDVALTAEESATIDQVGPIDISTFLQMLDRREIREDSIITIVARELWRA
jgi:hypothetical protein